MELSISNINFFYILSKQNVSYISKSRNTEKILLFHETVLSYISGNGNPKKLLIFQEVTFQDRKVKKLLIHQEVTCES